MIRASNAVSISGNTIINDKGKGADLWNAGGGAATFSNNQLYGEASVSGPANQTALHPDRHSDGSLASRPGTSARRSSVAPGRDTDPRQGAHESEC